MKIKTQIALFLGGTKVFDDEYIIYWDGQSTENNLENIKFWQNIYDLNKETKEGIVVIATDSNENKTAIFNIDFNEQKDIYYFETMKETLLGSDTEIGSILYYIYLEVQITINNDKIISTSGLIYHQTGRLEDKLGNRIGNNFLPTNIFNNPKIEAPIDYTPTEDYQPTNKKYVDEEINKKLSETKTMVAYGTCSTAGNIKDKVINLVDGSNWIFKRRFYYRS